MPVWEIIVIVGVIAAAVVAWMLIRRNQSRHLRARFGPEYDRLISEQGSRERVEKELAAREKRISRLQIRSLERPERERFVAEWRADQARFVDDPAGAVTGADRLIADVMRARPPAVHVGGEVALGLGLGRAQGDRLADGGDARGGGVWSLGGHDFLRLRVGRASSCWANASCACFQI